MPKIEAAIKDAILRGARRHVRAVATPLRRDVRRLRQVLRQLRQELMALKLVADGWQRSVENAPLIPQVTEEEAKVARLSPRLIRALRKRLGLSQAKLARVAEVSTTAVVWWESGRASPSGKHRAAIVALRKLGRRDVKGILTRLPKPPRAR